MKDRPKAVVATDDEGNKFHAYDAGEIDRYLDETWRKMLNPPNILISEDGTTVRMDPKPDGPQPRFIKLNRKAPCDTCGDHTTGMVDCEPGCNCPCHQEKRNPTHLFQDTSKALESVAERWVMLSGIPYPRQPLTCPQCRMQRIQLSSMNFAVRHYVASRWVFGSYENTPKRPLTYRANVNVKCCACSLYFTFGIPISREDFELAGGEGSVEWRDVRARLKTEGHLNA